VPRLDLYHWRFTPRSVNSFCPCVASCISFRWCTMWRRFVLPAASRFGTLRQSFSGVCM
jgi:hypothetical protein